jgi:hypothetical protein
VARVEIRVEARETEMPPPVEGGGSQIEEEQREKKGK